jgi:hypothetical protein
MRHLQDFSMNKEVSLIFIKILSITTFGDQKLVFVEYFPAFIDKYFASPGKPHLCGCILN